MSIHPTSRNVLALSIFVALLLNTARAQANPNVDANADAADPDRLVAARTLDAITVPGYRDPYRARESFSATKTQTPLRDIPQSINVVSAALLSDQGARSLEDALRNVPGVGASHGDGQRDQVSIRGFSAISDQFVDGMRDDALYFRDLSNIERVEVLKGPAAVLYGRGSSGGLINRVSKRPELGSFSKVDMNLGSDGQKRISSDFNRGEEESLGFRLNAATEDSDGYRDQQFLKRTAIAPSFSAQLGDNDSITLQASYLRDRRITDFGVPAFNGRPVETARESYYGSGNAARDDYTQSKVGAISALYSHKFSEALSVRNNTRLQTYDLDRNNTLPGGTVDSVTQTVGRSRGEVRRKEDGFFNQTDFVWRGAEPAAGTISQQLLFGVEFGKQQKYAQFVNQANIDRVNIFNPGNVVPPAISAAARASDAAIGSDTDLLVRAAYLQNQLNIGETLKLVGGVRFDSFKQETVFERKLTSLSRTDSQWSPRIGAVYQPNSAAAYYASVSESFQPSAEAFALSASNAANEPEVTRNLEVGGKWDLLDSRMSITAAVFNLERSNIKTSDPTRPGILINVGEQRTRGFEFTANGRINELWSVYSGFALLDGRITKSNSSVAAPQTPVVQIPLQGNRPSLTPRQSGYVWVNRELPAGFAVAGGLNYTAERFASPSNAVTLPGYTLLDLALHYRVERYELGLNLKNVLNRAHILSAHGGNDNLILPGPGRELQLSVRYHF